MTDQKLQYYVLICNKKQKDKFIKLLSEQGVLGIETVYATGSARPTGPIARSMGLEIEEHKAMITGFAAKDKALALTSLLCEKYGFDKANTGFAFSISIDGIAF